MAKKKILIADDEQEIIDLLTCAFEGEGFQIASISHGGGLPLLINKELPDLIILDVLMPGLDGYSLQLQLSQEEKTRNIPVVIITALPAAKTLFDKFPQVKMFINKPFDPNDMVKKVKEILNI